MPLGVAVSRGVSEGVLKGARPRYFLREGAAERRVNLGLALTRSCARGGGGGAVGREKLG